MKYTATITELYLVQWCMGEDAMRLTPPIFFEERKDAHAVASIPLGSYKGKGTVYTRTYIEGIGEKPPKAFKSVRDWADETLTMKQAREYGIV
jgi:hypothetical protein